DLYKKIHLLSRSIRSETSDEKWTRFAGLLDRLMQHLSEKDWKKTRLSVLNEIAQVRKPPFKKDSAPVSSETNEMAEETIDELRELKEVIYDPEVWPNFFRVINQFDPLARSFVNEFQRLKRSEGVLSIADLELLTAHGIRQHPETSVAFADEWDFWLID